jgi:hypothetical protein
VLRSALRSLSCALSCSVLLAFPAAATTLSMGLDVEFSGGVAPAGMSPWIKATFDDSVGGSNDVRLTLTANHLTGGASGESIGLWLFNFDPTLDPTLLTFTVVNNSASVPNGIATGVDAFQADGDGKYDIQFDFPPPPGSDAARFTGGETVTYDISYVGAIDVFSFYFQSVESAGNGTYYSGAHIQRTGGGVDSGWIGATGLSIEVVPEPSTGLLFGLGLGLVALARRRR